VCWNVKKCRGLRAGIVTVRKLKYDWIQGSMDVVISVVEQGKELVGIGIACIA
jgi:hypothetical protein